MSLQTFVLFETNTRLFSLTQLQQLLSEVGLYARPRSQHSSVTWAVFDCSTNRPAVIGKGLSRRVKTLAGVQEVSGVGNKLVQGSKQRATKKKIPRRRE